MTSNEYLNCLQQNAMEKCRDYLDRVEGQSQERYAQ
jgi:hypothetical protein